MDDDELDQLVDDEFDQLDAVGEETREDISEASFSGSELDRLLDEPKAKLYSDEDLFGEDEDEAPAPTSPPPLSRKRHRKPKKHRKDKRKKNHKRARVHPLTLSTNDDLDDLLASSESKSESESESDAGSASGGEAGAEVEGVVDSDPRETHELTVRAYSIVTTHPPVMIFKSLGSPAVEVTLMGDLVYDMACPLHAFKVRTRVVKEAIFEVEEIVKVVQGPIVKATVAAETIAKETRSAAPPEPVIDVKVADLKRTITRSGYFEMLGGSKTVAKLLAPLGLAVKKNSITMAQLERFVPDHGNAPIHWACRNVLATEDFFRMANLVGGRAVRSIGPSDKQMWDMITDQPNAFDSLGVPELDDDLVVNAFKRICFANPITGARLARLLHTFQSDCTRYRNDKMECVVQAAAILHQLPRSNDQRNTAVWGQSWPPMVRELLASDCGLYVRKASGGGDKWFACKQEMRQFYETVSLTVSMGDVHFIRAEEDDDHEALVGTSGYIENMRGAINDFAPNMLIVTKHAERLSYLRRYVAGHGARFLDAATCGPRAIRSGQTDVVWIDRSHQFEPDEIVQLIRTFAEDAQRVYVAGSTWSGATRSSGSTMFSQLFSDTRERETLSSTLASYKAATGKDPVKDIADVPTTTPLIIRRAAKILIPQDVVEAFPHAEVATLHELREKRGYALEMGAIVLLDYLWTKEDLAVVWQYVMPMDNSIWFVGGEDWEEVLQRSVRRTPSGAAAAQMIQ